MVGRRRELEHADALIARNEPTPTLLVVYGPGGIGKSRLLDEIAARGRRAGRLVRRLRAEDIDGSVARPPQSGNHLANRANQPLLFLIDECDDSEIIARWVIQAHFPAAASALVVIATRKPPPTGLRDTDRLRRAQLDLGALSPEESAELLSRHTLDAATIPRLVSIAAGHPLALLLLAELVGRGVSLPASLEQVPDLLQALVQRVAETTSDPDQRAALDALVVAGAMTEPLLAAMTGREEANQLFDWLRDRSFVRLRPEGLVPHDLVRHALAAELRWRAPERLEALRRRALPVYLGRLYRGSVHDQVRAIRDLFFLFREHPVMVPLVSWTQVEESFVRRITEDDLQPICAAVERHEGAASAKIAAHWLRRQPEGAYVLDTPGRNRAGYFHLVRLDLAGEEDYAVDPIAREARAVVRKAGVDRALPVAFNRFWLDVDQYQSLGTVMTLCTGIMAHHQVMIPGIAFALGVFHDPGGLRAMFEVFGFATCGSVAMDDRTYQLIGRDWRGEPPLTWFSRFVERITGATPQPSPEKNTAPVTRADEVRDALKVWHEPHRLASSALAQRLLEPATANEPLSVRAQRVRAAIDAAMSSLEGSRRGKRAMAALRATYVDALGTQEEVAEELDLPFSTYRRHLGEGFELLADLLSKK